MQTAVDLKLMSLPEKLRLMEALWDDLCREEKNIPVPEWQQQILAEREQLAASGKATFSDWESAKQRIKNRTA